MAATFESPGRRLGAGVGRGALLGGWLCVVVACGGRVPVLGADGAAGAVGTADAADAADRAAPDGAAERADAADAGPRDGAIDGATPPPPDGAVDTSGDRQDARDGAADGAPDGARDGAADGAQDTVDAPVETRPDTGGTPGCPVDCAHLPHVRAGITVGCSTAGTCIFPPGACEDGFAHCSNNYNDGCEADLSNPTTCGGCYNRCYSPYSVCSSNGGSYYCGPVCSGAAPNSCYNGCVDFQSDPSNCGACGHGCYLPNAITGCAQGQCTFVRCSDQGYADCTAEPGCETPLGNDTNCAKCGDKACTLANTLFSCSSANSCASAVCSAGFGNCDATSPDCETAFSGGGSCLPGYLGTTPLATQALNDTAVAIGSDGAYFVAGEFFGTVDFDPSAAQDIRATTIPDDVDGFITKINADGSYAWTRTFAGRGSIAIHGLAAAASGAVVAVGNYGDSLDLDPGSGADLHQTVTPYQHDGFVVKLAADGSFAWGRTFVGMNGSSSSDASGVGVDGADAVYVAGSYQSAVDFDSGVGASVRTSDQQAGMIVKLTGAGAVSWVRSIEDGACVSALTAVAVATDGAIWSVGSAGAGPGCTLPSADGTSSSTKALIVSTSGAGAAGGLWTLGGSDSYWQVMATGVAAGANGAVYVSGSAGGGMVDFDPGPGEARRWMGQGPDGYIVKLGASGSFNWVQTVAGTSIDALAGTSDGGVLGVGSSSNSAVTKLNADGTAAWTFAPGASGASARAVAARGATFAVAGFSSGSGDFNPGTDIDIVFGDIVYMSRFSF